MDMTPQAWPDWYDGKHINEVLFCQQFLDKHPMKCVRGRLFTVDGLIEDEGQIGNLILEEISGVLTSGLSKVVTNLLASIKLQAYSPPLPIETDRRDSIPHVIAEAEKLGYKVDKMAISGGSAGGTLALLYAYRDAEQSPVPVKMVFEAVGPASFHHEDWKNYGLDQNTEAAANLFSVMSGNAITEEMITSGSYDEQVKDISADMWVNENTVPTVCAYGAQDKVCPFDSVKHLVNALEANDVPHEYFELTHSGHALQNDNKLYAAYMDAVEDYLARYIPVK